jgi:hypothetical protein
MSAASSWKDTRLLTKFPASLELEYSLTRSQKPVIGSYLTPIWSIPSYPPFLRSSFRIPSYSFLCTCHLLQAGYLSWPFHVPVISRALWITGIGRVRKHFANVIHVIKETICAMRSKKFLPYDLEINTKSSTYSNLVSEAIIWKSVSTPLRKCQCSENL